MANMLNEKAATSLKTDSKPSKPTHATKHPLARAIEALIGDGEAKKISNKDKLKLVK